MASAPIAGAIATAALAPLALLVPLRWRNEGSWGYLWAAVLATIAWAVGSALAPGPAPVPVGAALDLLKSYLWIAFLSCAIEQPWSTRGVLLLRGVPAAILVMGLAVSAGDLAEVDLPFGLSLERSYPLLALVMAVFGLALVLHVAQIAGGIRSALMWASKFVWLGVGAIFAYDAVYFTAAVVSGSADRDLWIARDLVVALAAPLIGVSVSRLHRSRARLVLSRRFAYFAATLLAAAAYVLGVGIVRHYLQELGGEVGRALIVVSIAAAGLGFVAAMLSGTVRARLRVVLNKYFLAHKYDYRDEWLRLTAALAGDDAAGTLPERALPVFIRLAGARGGGIWVREDAVFRWQAGDLGDPAVPSEPADGAFCRALESRAWIFDVAAARAGRGPDAAMPLPGWLAAMDGAHLVIPLVHKEVLTAFVVLQQAIIEEPLTWEDFDLLRTVGRQTASYFAVAQAADELARERQFAALSRFTAFVMHDLTNVIAQQRLAVENAARHRHNAEFVDDMIATITDTVRRTTRLLEQLKGGDVPSAPRRVPLAAACERAVARCSDRLPRPALAAGAAPVAAFVAEQALDFALEHAIRNAQDAAPEGRVEVRLREVDSWAEIEIADSGRGMSAEFVRERLFRPFDTTKGSKGMGIGAFQIREFVRAAGGEVSVTSVPGAGTSLVLRLKRDTRDSND